MDNFLGTSLYRSKVVDKVLIDPLDIPIISYDNAILYSNHNDDYMVSFALVPIKSGVIRYNNRYYYFDHDIVNTPKTRYWCDCGSSICTTCHSYCIYPIGDELAQEVISNRSVNIWMVKFHSFYYYGGYYLSIREGNYNRWYGYKSTMYSIGMVVPYSISPSDLLDGCTIGNYLMDHKRNPRQEVMELNRSVIRDQVFDVLGI